MPAGSLRLHARDWAAAAKIIHNWEATGKIGEEPPDIPNIKRAVEKYLADAEARHLAPETVRKRRELLEGKLLPFCEAKGYVVLSHLDVDVLRTFARRGRTRRCRRGNDSSISAVSFASAMTAAGSIATRHWR